MVTFFSQCFLTFLENNYCLSSTNGFSLEESYQMIQFLTFLLYDHTERFVGEKRKETNMALTLYSIDTHFDMSTSDSF